MRFFFICSLPRSRTAWLANFLTSGPSYCLHDGLVGCRSIHQLRIKLALHGGVDKSAVGNSDCGNVLFIDKIRQVFPDAPLLVVDRDPDDSRKSISAIGLSHPDELFTAFTNALEHTKSRYRPMVVSFDQLSDLDVLSRVWGHLVGPRGFDPVRAQMLADLNVQPTRSKLHRDVAAGGQSFHHLVRNTKHHALKGII